MVIFCQDVGNKKIATMLETKYENQYWFRKKILFCNLKLELVRTIWLIRNSDYKKRSGADFGFLTLKINRIWADLGFFCLLYSSERSALRIRVFARFNFIRADRSKDFHIFRKHWMGVEWGFFKTVVLSERSGHGQNRIFCHNVTNPILRTNSTLNHLRFHKNWIQWISC